MFQQAFDLGGKYNSRLEGKVWKEFKEWGIQPEWNYKVDFFEIDFAFPNIKLAIEIDGAKFHTAENKERDEWRQKLLEKKGWVFERFDGWFAYRYTDVLVVKILLKYFEPTLEELIKRRAKITLGVYFKELDPELSSKLLESALNKLTT